MNHNFENNWEAFGIIWQTRPNSILSFWHIELSASFIQDLIISRLIHQIFWALTKRKFCFWIISKRFSFSIRFETALSTNQLQFRLFCNLADIQANLIISRLIRQFFWALTKCEISKFKISIGSFLYHPNSNPHLSSESESHKSFVITLNTFWSRN